MRITMIISSLHAGGGAEKIFAVIANHWAAAGHDVSVVILESGAPFYEMDKKVSVTRLGLAEPSSGIIKAIVNNAGRLMALRGAIRRTRPSLIVSFMTEVNVLAILAAMRTGAPVIACERVNPFAGLEKKVWRLLRRLSYPLARKISAQTAGAARFYEGWTKGRVEVIPNPVEPAGGVCSQPPKEPGNVIVAMGRLERQKGFDLLLHAFAKIHAAHADWTLSIYGEGPARDELETLRAGLGLENHVKFHGKTGGPRMAFASGRIFVLSSRFEGFPNALLEAMACGLAAVSFDCPFGPGEIIRNGVDGLLVPNGDADALACAMDRLIVDAGLRNRLSSAAPKVAERFSTARIMEMWDGLLRSVAA